MEEGIAMQQPGCFSDNTVRYLNRFEEILDNMIAGMQAAMPTDSISDTFIAEMIPHHMAAIEMSRSLLRYTTCIPLQQIAQGIVTAQTKSIEDMCRAQPVCRRAKNTRTERDAYLQAYHAITQTMFTDMRGAQPDNNINISFMREMIPHHRGAVEMSKNALRYPICPELKPILQAIITSQERGIRQMEELLRTVKADGC